MSVSQTASPLLEPGGGYRKRALSQTIGIAPEDLRVRDSDCPAAETPLETAWTFWYDKRTQDKKESDAYMEGLRQLGSFSTIEGFYRHYSFFLRPEELPRDRNVLLFRKGYKPMWEEFPEGGCWIIRIKRKVSKGYVNRMWEDLLLACVGEAFEMPDVVGVVLSTRHKDDVISIWNLNNRVTQARFRIGEKLKELLNLDINALIQYKDHMQSLHDFSTFRNAKNYMFAQSNSTTPFESGYGTPRGSEADFEVLPDAAIDTALPAAAVDTELPRGTQRDHSRDQPCTSARGGRVSSPQFSPQFAPLPRPRGGGIASPQYGACAGTPDLSSGGNSARGRSRKLSRDAEPWYPTATVVMTGLDADLPPSAVDTGSMMSGLDADLPPSAVDAYSTMPRLDADLPPSAVDAYSVMPPSLDAGLPPSAVDGSADSPRGSMPPASASQEEAMPPPGAAEAPQAAPGPSGKTWAMIASTATEFTPRGGPAKAPPEAAIGSVAGRGELAEKGAGKAPAAPAVEEEAAKEAAKAPAPAPQGAAEDPETTAEPPRKTWAQMIAATEAPSSGSPKKPPKR